jgi:hypothetical protein
MDPWYKIVTARKEVREGRSFNPDEFAIHLEQVVGGQAPDDYRLPGPFFARTCFTRALREHLGMVLRRLSGITENSAPVLTLITQFGGGKTHTLTALYHLARGGPETKKWNGVKGLLEEAGLADAPRARVAVFVGNAWDPQPGRETPWIDLARQLAEDDGVKALGPAAKTKPPGTEALGRVFQAAGGCVLILFDEVLNFLNRHRDLAESFHAFIQNLTVATTGTTHGAAVISLPRSQVEMTDWDLAWQEKITKVVRRVAKDLIANDEAEISEVLRLRLFEDLGSERTRKAVARSYAEWCFQRRAELPPEWTAVDTAATERKAREFLQKRFEDCYPFHPATISVFQRKWQTLAQFQQTRGTLAMLAQWISWAARSQFEKARREALITLGSAPLEVQAFRSVVLGQLGESRLGPDQLARPRPGRRHEGAAAGHPPPGRHGHLLRVVGRADQPYRPPARAALRPGRAGHGHHVHRQRGAGAGGPGLLHPQGGLRRLPDQSSRDPQEGGQRPQGFPRFRERGPAGDAEARPGGVRPRGEHPGPSLPGRWRRHFRYAAADAGADGPRAGVVGAGPAAAASRRVDAPAGDDQPRLPGLAGLVLPQARPGAA